MNVPTDIDPAEAELQIALTEEALLAVYNEKISAEDALTGDMRFKNIAAWRAGLKRLLPSSTQPFSISEEADLAQQLLDLSREDLRFQIASLTPAGWAALLYGGGDIFSRAILIYEEQELPVRISLHAWIENGTLRVPVEQCGGIRRRASQQCEYEALRPVMTHCIHATVHLVSICRAAFFTLLVYTEEIVVFDNATLSISDRIPITSCIDDVPAETVSWQEHTSSDNDPSPGSALAGCIVIETRLCAILTQRALLLLEIRQDGTLWTVAVCMHPAALANEFQMCSEKRSAKLVAVDGLIVCTFSAVLKSCYDDTFAWSPIIRSAQRLPLVARWKLSQDRRTTTPSGSFLGHSCMVYIANYASIFLGWRHIGNLKSEGELFTEESLTPDQDGIRTALAYVPLRDGFIFTSGSNAIPDSLTPEQSFYVPDQIEGHRFETEDGAHILMPCVDVNSFNSIQDKTHVKTNDDQRVIFTEPLNESLMGQQVVQRMLPSRLGQNKTAQRVTLQLHEGMLFSSKNTYRANLVGENEHDTWILVSGQALVGQPVALIFHEKNVNETRLTAAMAAALSFVPLRVDTIATNQKIVISLGPLEHIPLSDAAALCVATATKLSAKPKPGAVRPLKTVVEKDGVELDAIDQGCGKHAEHLQWPDHCSSNMEPGQAMHIEFSEASQKIHLVWHESEEGESKIFRSLTSALRREAVVCEANERQQNFPQGTLVATEGRVPSMLKASTPNGVLLFSCGRLFQVDPWETLGALPLHVKERVECAAMTHHVGLALTSHGRVFRIDNDKKYAVNTEFQFTRCDIRFETSRSFVDILGAPRIVFLSRSPPLLHCIAWQSGSLQCTLVEIFMKGPPYDEVLFSDHDAFLVKRGHSIQWVVPRSLDATAPLIHLSGRVTWMDSQRKVFFVEGNVSNSIGSLTEWPGVFDSPDASFMTITTQSGRHTTATLLAMPSDVSKGDTEVLHADGEGRDILFLVIAWGQASNYCLARIWAIPASDDPDWVLDSHSREAHTPFEADLRRPSNARPITLQRGLFHTLSAQLSANTVWPLEYLSREKLGLETEEKCIVLFYDSITGLASACCCTF